MGEIYQELEKPTNHLQLAPSAQLAVQPAGFNQDLETLILELWESEARKSIAAFKHLDQNTLMGPISLIVKKACYLLELTRTPPEEIAPARVYADTRAKLGGHSLELGSIEFNLLRRVIFSTLEKKSPLPPLARDQVLDYLSGESGACMGELMRTQQGYNRLYGENINSAESRYIDLVNHLRHAIAWIAEASSGRFAFVSHQAEDILGYSVHEWLGSPNFLQRHLHPDDVGPVNQAFERARGSGADQTLEHRIFDSQGYPRWFQTSIQVEKDYSGRPSFFRGLCFDITRRKELEVESQHYLAASKIDLNRLHEERELRERFVNTLTHDLRNPLATAKLTAQLILRDKNPEGQAVKVQRMIESINRIDRMIQDLLNANRIQAGQLATIQVQFVNITSLVMEVVEEQTAIHGPRFVVATGSETVSGGCSADGMRRILENLINNAVKYGAKQTPIAIKLAQHGTLLRLSVHNEGNEISAADQATLFDLFRRTSAAHQGGQMGWGIGLTLVKGIATAHGGRAWVESGDGRGTTFSVEIPLAGMSRH